MFGLMPIECPYDDPACLSGGGGYILGPGDVFNPPNDKRYGFDVPPPMQNVRIGNSPNVPDNSYGVAGNNNPLIQSLLNSPQIPVVGTTTTHNPLVILAIIAGAIYLITK